MALAVMALVVLLAVFLRFREMPGRIAGVGNQRPRRRVFGFRRQALAAVTDADDFFARRFSWFCAARRHRGDRHRRAHQPRSRHGLPEPSHATVLRYDGRFFKERLRASDTY
jgi:hypothetical protein